jgi:peptidoglycan/LPS O-acetylase OafA/YrhL
LGKIKEIERLRAIAVIMVAVCHVSFISRFLPAPFTQSWSGVDLFFVISGFVVSRSLLNSLPQFRRTSEVFERFSQAHVPLRNFYLRRAYRILPLAIVWMILPLLASFFFNSTGAFGNFTRYKAYSEAFAILTFQYNYALIFGAVPGLLGYYWSLSVEEHFYFLLPLLLIFIPKDKARLTFSLAVAVLIILFVRPLLHIGGTADRQWMWIRFASHNRFDGLFLGVACALVSRNWSTAKKTDLTFLKPFGICLAYFCLAGLWLSPGAFFNTDFPQTLSLSLQAAFSTILVLLAYQQKGSVVEIPWFSRGLELMGARSYAIYLIHGPIARFVTEICGRFSWNLSPISELTLWLFCMIVFVEFSHQFIEKPAMRFIQKRLSDSSIQNVQIAA